MYDTINDSFELIAGLFLILNIVELYKRKITVGIHILPVFFFTLWGIWNIIYYPAIGQKLSFYAGLLIVFNNGIWVIMALYYKYKNSNKTYKIKRK